MTGASRGIGRAVAAALGRAGARLVLASRGGAALEEAAAACAGVPVAADLTVDRELEALLDATLEALDGPPDIVVGAAGVFALRPVAETPVEILDRHLRLNLRAPFLIVRRLLPGMLERGSGHFVHLGSVAGRRPFPENGAYSASKYGLRGLHEVLRLELAGTGVRSTLVEPGAVDTGAWDGLEGRLGRDLPRREDMLRPAAVAEAVLAAVRLGSDGADADILLLPS